MRKDQKLAICLQAPKFTQSMRENTATSAGTADKVVSRKAGTT